MVREAARDAIDAGMRLRHWSKKRPVDEVEDDGDSELEGEEEAEEVEAKDGTLLSVYMSVQRKPSGVFTREEMDGSGNGERKEFNESPREEGEKEGKGGVKWSLAEEEGDGKLFVSSPSMDGTGRLNEAPPLSVTKSAVLDSFWSAMKYLVFHTLLTQLVS